MARKNVGISVAVVIAVLALVFIGFDAAGVVVNPPRGDLDYGLDADALTMGGEYVGETVNILNGNVVDVTLDFRIPSPHAMGLSFSRGYNSKSTENGWLGSGWTHTYFVRIFPPNPPSEPCLKLFDETGKRHYFDDQQDGSFTGAFQEKSRVQYDGVTQTFTWYRLDGRLYGFNSSGKLLWIDDPAGNRLSVAYNAQGRISTVTDNSTGRSLTFHYKTGYMDYISGPSGSGMANGTWITFDYDTNTNLTSVEYADTSGFAYEYGDSNHLHAMTSKKDKMNHVLAEWTYETGAGQRCNSNFTRNGLGAKTIAYTSSSRIDVTDVYDVARAYTKDGVGVLNRITAVDVPNAPYARNNAVSWTFDTAGNRTEIHYAGGRVDKYQDFDSRGNPQTVILGYGDANQRTITYTYHPQMNAPLTRTEASVLQSGSNKVTTWDYDSDGDGQYNENPTSLLYRLIEEGFRRNGSLQVVSYQNITAYTYNGSGQVTLVDWPRSGTGDTTTFTYDSTTKDLLTVVKPLIGTTTFSSYDAAGYPGEITDVNSRHTTLVYDARARLTETHYLTGLQGAGVRSVHYNQAGEIDSETDEDGVSRTYDYDQDYGHLVKITDQGGDYITLEYEMLHYNKTGREDYPTANLITKEYRDSAGTLTRSTAWSYQGPDHKGLLSEEIQADAMYTEYRYNSAGKVSTVTDPNGNTTTYDPYDVFGRPTTITQPGNVQTGLTYDTQANLKTVTDPGGVQTVYDYDDMGRLIKVNSPDAGVSNYGYFTDNTLAFKNTGGPASSYTYDDLARLVSATYSAYGGQPELTFTYAYDAGTDGKGHLTSITDPSGTTSLSYDPRGRLKQKTTTISGFDPFTLSREFTAGGRVSTITLPSGRTVTYERSGGCACRVSEIHTALNSNTSVLFDSPSFRPFGEVAAMSAGNGGSVSNLFDLDGRMTTANPGASKERGFTYYPNGQLHTMTAPNVVDPLLTYTYDSLNRLWTAQGPMAAQAPFWSHEYLYDAAGNRETVTRDAQTDTYACVSGKNRLDSVTGATTTSYTYDAAGKPTAIGDRSLTWNQDQRLIQVAEGENVLADYTYNALGERVKKVAGEVTTLYLYDFDGNLVAEAGGNGSIQKEYIYRGRVRLAMADAATGAVYHFHNDQFGTPVLMTDSTNTAVWEAAYEPFGLTSVNLGSTVVNNFRFQGQYYDEETGWRYNYHRYYDAKTGRYLSPDPIGLAGGMNPYVYADNDPVNLVDSSGFGALAVVQPYAGQLAMMDGPLPFGDLMAVGVLAIATAYDLTQKTYITYTLTNPCSGQVYVGRASGYGASESVMASRFTTHEWASRGFGPPVLDRFIQGITGYPAIRGREQQLIDFYGGVGSPNVANLIRGVSRMNPVGPYFHNTSNSAFGPLAPYTGY